ncbi:hypothetical protein KQ247_00695 [Ruegeria pomeroyi]|jgi:hypothetical protein|uniref:Uncharacterized protein n=2 Tax=Ruegeria pomeroyi TaxID=89184 RepID=Q5LQZ0_RUEPO|nr:hypothetical protein [Ruegeria pomeroyi]AAV95604.1 hypothetical protein SPO2342 [Ruegeria pomeroyi DSS-3]NVK97213.1 hypothetical protein [Ruegeria pomeroyi]NVL04029.1 hypothetical protein [Ruegeria pomeroyi]QWV09187.1 hypothetical protein KQ247_00695 [Ruegeria pomeroyi]
MLKITTIALSLALPATSVLAKNDKVLSEEYICETKSYSNIGWIPPKICFAMDRSSGAAVVYDGYIKEIYGDVIQADLKKRSDDLWEFRWELKDAHYSNSPGSTDVEYKATLNTRKASVNISAIHSGMDGDALRGQGKCERGKKK